VGRQGASYKRANSKMAEYSRIWQVTRSSTVTVILNSMTRIGLIIYIEDPEETPSIDYAHIENTEAEETTIVDIITTGHFIRSNATSVINLDAS
jgi:hypothetical protein